MATYTENYNLEKPALDEIVDVNVINNNYDVIDEALGNAQELASNIGSAYNSIIAYNVGDYCIYNNNLYKCVQATSSGDSFNPAKWQICKVTDDLGNVVANPSGSATTSLTKLEVDGTIYGISGGGGGSTVVVTPTLQSGTKVADIEVDNVTSTLYAPTPTEVEANPSGTGTATLSKLKVGSTTYNVSQGGGSTVTVSQTLSSGTEVAGIIVDGNETKLYAPTPTNVVANPSGQATTELDKLTVGSTIYKIPDDVEANPTATGTTDLNKLRVGSTTYNIPSGGGATTLNGLTDVDLNNSSNGQILKYDGINQKWVNANESTGSTVVWNQITQTGTKIATVSIDGTPTDVYAPTSGGGGGGDILINDRDWTLITSSFGTTQLTNTYDYYLWIVICNGKIDHYKIIDSSLLDLETNEDSIIEYKSWNDGTGAYSSSRVTITASSVTLWDNNQNAVSAKLYGANKKSSGGGSSWTDVTGTLTAGQTEITLSSTKLGANSTLDFYTSKFGINPIDVEINSGTETQLQEFVSSESELDGTISASSYLNNSYAPWEAFLDSTGYGWVGDNISEDTWLSYDFGTNVTVSKVQWTCGDNSRRGILSKLQYSSDGITWNDATLSTNERCNVILQTPTTARYWRMYYNAPFGSYQQPMVSQLRFLASGYSVTLTFEEQEENLGVKVRIY